MYHVRPVHRAFLYASAVALAIVGPGVASAEPAPRLAEGVQDNSFLIEEAYNQDPGVVQHILNITRNVNHLSGPDDKSWSFVFTQEWPAFSQKHQLSYTIPYTFSKTGGQSDNGIGDIFLNYRFQATTETATMPAFAPRVSLIVPTGDADLGFGNGTVGYQVNLPVSKIVSDRWTVHGNAGATFLPNVDGQDLMSYNLGASAIFAVSARFNLMLEAIASWDAKVDDAGRRDRSFSAIISPGLRYAFDHKSGAQTVIGLATPIGLRSSAPDYGVLLYFSFEHPFTHTSESPTSK